MMGLSVAVLLLPAAAIGLTPGDDIDALVYIEDGVPGPSPGDTILFSLTPGSATLALLGASPADVLAASPGGVPGVFAPAGALALLTTDNIDALDVVPEPSQTLLFGTALLGLALRRRRA